MNAHDAFNLQRFIDAQDPVHTAVVTELRAGRKRTHWMWFVFPQHRALGRSDTAKRFGIDSIAEARAYAAHAVLGARLRECCALLLALQGRTANEIFGSPDDLKLRSSMTLFAVAVEDDPVFTCVLDKYCRGARDERTVALLAPLEDT
jgi:uncharacterized protein (DUF1810 family)